MNFRKLNGFFLVAWVKFGFSKKATKFEKKSLSYF